MRQTLRLFHAWFTGRYRVFPLRTLVYFLVAVVYTVSPVDILPDYVPFFGVIDDAALLGLVWHSLLKDAKKFAEWEKWQTQ